MALLDMLPSMDGKVISGLGSATVLGLVLFATCFFVETTPETKWIDKATNVGTFVLGSCIGWLIGVYLSPYTEAERALFQGTAGSIAGFISGYLVGKVDDLIKYIFNPENFFRKLALYRTLLFFSCLMLGTLMVFIGRTYVHESTGVAQERQDSVIPSPKTPPKGGPEK